MLVQLSVRNFALVDGLTLEPGPGFTVLTGETGAGKSILIDALTAALGDRGGADLVRAGAERAEVEAVFEVGPSALPAVQECAEDGQVILAREIGAGGRSSFRINGRLTTAGQLRELAGHLVDIHGQHEHQSLLSPARHVEFLDAWAGLAARRHAAAELLGELRGARAELEAMRQSARERVRMQDLYRFQVQEIDQARLRPGEEEELDAELARLAHGEKLTAAAAAAHVVLAEGEPSVLDLLAAAARELGAAAALDPAAAAIRESVEAAAAHASEAAGELRSYVEGLEPDPERLAAAQERQELYRSLKRKYGDTVEEVLAYRLKVADELDSLDRGEEREEELAAREARLEEELDRSAGDLHARRLEAAERFEREIAAHLADLGMQGTRFGVRLDVPASAADRSAKSPLGAGEFLLSANPGESLRPLARIASGGELSRVMLALKTAMAGSHPVSLVFDEIDAGVGGRTAEALGRKMAQLSRSNQVLCVTHLPQIACMAERHLLVHKQAEGDRTRVEVTTLDGETRVGELARMLGGSAATASQHARQLLANAREATAAH